jgi:hypothetical protein
LKLRTVAAAVGVINGAWAAGAAVYWSQLFGVSGGPNPALAALGLLIAFSSLAGLIGPPDALYGPIAFSLVEILGIAAFATDVGSAFDLSLVLAVATIALSFFAARKKTFVPEEDHPLNLPVFG